MQPTILAYMLDQHKTDHKATVLAVEPNAKDALTRVILNETVFYPQGGGQAWDTGTMTAPTGTFAVQEVRFVDGFVHHYGNFAEGTFASGAIVECRVDRARRVLNSRLHSAGHLLDEAVKNIGLSWTPTKGIHYPGQAAVEYSGTVDNAEALKATLETEVNRLIGAGYEVRAEMVDLADLPKRSDFVPLNLPGNKPIRVVTMGGAKGTPCGGTHVRDISEIGPMKIRYIKAKKGDIKVAYEIVE
jgi:Ser-tRNA(Ala) deacylase AlaX